MFWSFAFLAAVAWLLYLALQRRIDSAVRQLKREFAAVIEGLKNNLEPVSGSEVLRQVDSAVGQLKRDISSGLDGLKQGRVATTAEREEQKDKHYELIRELVDRNLSAWTGRYTVQDAYTISELTRSYDRKDNCGRIQLLRRVYRQTPRLPYELALRAVTDSDAAVREWMARKAQNLDYGGTRHESADALLDVHPPGQGPQVTASARLGCVRSRSAVRESRTFQSSPVA